MTTPSTAPPGLPLADSARTVLLLCWIAVILDGFDLVVLGALIPALTSGPAPFMTTGEATFVSTISLVGMTFGALLIGLATDRIGRRRVMIWTVAGFSLATLACAFAQSWVDLGLYRFLAGVGLGGCLPTAIALVTEVSKSRPGTAATNVMTGYHIGAVSTALLALLLLPQFGWRVMFVAGALPGFVLALVMARKLPESNAYLQAQPTQGDQRLTVRTLLRPPYLRHSLALWTTSFMGLILVYGLNTWLPKLMIAAGYDLRGGLWLLLLMNAGAIAGLLFSGRLADRIGLKTAAVLWFGISAVLLALLSVRLNALALYPLVFVTGSFVFSAQVLVYAWVAASHPPEIRASALGITAGIGRLGAITGPLAGGLLVTWGLGHPWGFYVFALIAGLACCAALTGRKS